jgi:hypothetical protein
MCACWKSISSARFTKSMLENNNRLLYCRFPEYTYCVHTHSSESSEPNSNTKHVVLGSNKGRPIWGPLRVKMRYSKLSAKLLFPIGREEYPSHLMNELVETNKDFYKKYWLSLHKNCVVLFLILSPAFFRYNRADIFSKNVLHDKMAE